MVCHCVRKPRALGRRELLRLWNRRFVDDQYFGELLGVFEALELRAQNLRSLFESRVDFTLKHRARVSRNGLRVQLGVQFVQCVRVVQLIGVANKRHLFKNDMRLEVAEWTLVVVVCKLERELTLSRVEESLHFKNVCVRLAWRSRHVNQHNLYSVSLGTYWKSAFRSCRRALRSASKPPRPDEMGSVYFRPLPTALRN